MPSTQRPRTHGALAHSSTLTTQPGPLQALGHTHTKELTPSTQVPPCEQLEAVQSLTLTAHVAPLQPGGQSH